MEYSKQAKRAITGASKLSKSLQHSYVGTEHLMLAILKSNNNVACDPVGCWAMLHQPLQSLGLSGQNPGQGGPLTLQR